MPDDGDSTGDSRYRFSGMNLTFGPRSMSASRSNVKFENSTRIIKALVVLLFPTFALGADTKGTQMLETNH
ncbi:hypothetical protein CHELA17_20496 [Chelatococcus asaccharovorans]|nr:hypothetical protein CHELA17_20496 [Chelatococcus asaccharovorans]